MVLEPRERPTMGPSSAVGRGSPCGKTHRGRQRRASASETRRSDPNPEASPGLHGASMMEFCSTALTPCVDTCSRPWLGARRRNASKATWCYWKRLILRNGYDFPKAPRSFCFLSHTPLLHQPHPLTQQHGFLNRINLA